MVKIIFPYNLNRTPYKAELPSVESRRGGFRYAMNGASVMLAANYLVSEYKKTEVSAEGIFCIIEKE